MLVAAARLGAEPCVQAAASLARGLLYLLWTTSNTGDTMSNEIEADVQAYSSPPKGSARRRVDAYHETLRERNALRELEQPFLTDVGSWHPRHF